MAVRFDGTSGEDFRRTANLPAFSAFTACGWAKLSVDTNAYATIWALQSAGDYIILATDSDGTSLKLFDTGVSTATIATLTVGQWFFWAVVGSSATNRVAYYALPGATSLTASGTLSTNVSSTTNRMSLGDDSFGEPWNGCIERVRVWDAALSTAELLQEMNRTAPARYSNLNIFSPMIASTVALSATDYSGNGRNWTANGTLAVEHGAPVSWGARPIIVPFASAGGSATLAADGGSFTLTGADVTLRRSNTIAADGGTFSLTGADISLEYGRAISAEAGSFTLTGADFAVDLSMAADGGSFALNGSDVTLTYSGGSRTLAAEAGSFAWTGADIALEYNRLIAADSGTFTVNGSDVTLTRNVPMTAGEGAFSVAGADVGFGRTYLLNAENGIFTLGGADVGLVDSGAAERALELPSGGWPSWPQQRSRKEVEEWIRQERIRFGVLPPDAPSSVDSPKAERAREEERRAIEKRLLNAASLKRAKALAKLEAEYIVALQAEAQRRQSEAKARQQAQTTMLALEEEQTVMRLIAALM